MRLCVPNRWQTIITDWSCSPAAHLVSEMFILTEVTGLTIAKGKPGAAACTDANTLLSHKLVFFLYIYIFEEVTVHRLRRQRDQRNAFSLAFFSKRFSFS